MLSQSYQEILMDFGLDAGKAPLVLTSLGPCLGLVILTALACPLSRLFPGTSQGPRFLCHLAVI